MPVPLIVLIDDEPLFRRSMATLLTRHGYRVEVAATATDGLALLCAAQPDLLLLDRPSQMGMGSISSRWSVAIGPTSPF